MRQRRAYTTTPRHYAYVKIAEGCDYTCAFCIIPTLRGEYRSRTRDSIVKEAGRSPQRGVKELLLISQDTTVLRHRSPGARRAGEAAARAERRRRARVDPACSTCIRPRSPTTCSTAMAECEKVCKYVDLPLQHASADVLKRMRRPGNRQTYDKLLARIRTRVPGVTLRTTFIVGFPGETDGRVRRARGLRRATRSSITSASSRTRTRKGRGRMRWTTTCRRRSKRKRRDRADGTAAADRGGAAARRGSGRRSRS